MSSEKEMQRAKWLTSFASGQKWLEKIGSANTKKIFTDYFKRYCDSVQKNPDQLIAFKIEGLMAINTSKEFQAEELLNQYFRDNKRMRPTAKLMLKNSVFSFYKHNMRRLNAEALINVKDQTPAAKKRKPSLDDLEALEKAMRTSRDKALLWFVASTSVRVGTLILLKWQDLKPTQNPNVPYSLEIEAARLKGSGIGKYRGVKQICFVHKFASEKLEQYKAEAKAKGYDLKEDSPLFIAYYQKGQEDKENPQKPLIKPQKRLSIKGCNELFNHISLAAFGDLEKKRFSIHDLREFFQSALESAGIQENLISPLMAHKVAGISQSYSSHEPKELLKIYESALPFLVPKSVPELQAELTKSETEKEKRIKFLETRLLDAGMSINKMTANYEVLAQEVKRLSNQPETVKID